MERAYLKPKEDRRLLRGHVWVYRNELASCPQLPEGEQVDVYSAQRRFIGRGFVESGGIAVRLLSRHQEPLDSAWFAEQIASAGAFRERLYPGESAYRWVHSESDGLPGFVADRYGGVVVAHSECVFYAKHADEIAAAFLANDGVRGVRITVRGKAHDAGEVAARTEILLNGLRFLVDLDRGQKTGMYLDQRENCRAVCRYVHGARVLDGHCYAGLWSCHAASAGATSVLGIDTSGPAIEWARQNAELNGLRDRCAFRQADVREVLAGDDRFDTVILDPPPLARSRGQAKGALGVYQALSRAALRAIEPGGFLVLCSCSHAVSSEDLLEAAKRAGRAGQRQLRLVEMRGAAPDHPISLAVPETDYLHCAIIEAR